MTVVHYTSQSLLIECVLCVNLPIFFSQAYRSNEWTDRSVCGINIDRAWYAVYTFVIF